jgi:hypothetical protein
MFLSGDPQRSRGRKYHQPWPSTFGPLHCMLGLNYVAGFGSGREGSNEGSWSFIWCLLLSIPGLGTVVATNRALPLSMRLLPSYSSIPVGGPSSHSIHFFPSHNLTLLTKGGGLSTAFP